MKSPKRTKEVKIRLTDQEHQILLDKKIGAELATWIRNTCLETKTPKKKPIKTADPELLRQLAKIGVILTKSYALPTPSKQEAILSTF